MEEGQRITLVLMSVIFFDQLCWTQGQNIILTHYSSRFGVCHSECKESGGHYGCNTEAFWDYCSLRENTDYSGYECKDDHPCGKHNENYYWCWRKAGSWGYCGNVEPKPLLHISSHYRSVCRDECSYSGGYFWCHTDVGWDYCSPMPDVTYKNEPCRSDHPCGRYGYSYTWCKTDSDWDYCGIIGSNECRYIDSYRKKRQPSCSSNSQMVMICARNDKGNRRETRFYAEPAPDNIRDGSQWRTQITNIIALWNNGHLVDHAKSQLITLGGLRIDQQGMVVNNGRYYYNLQIQLNTIRQPGTSTTVAQVLIPRDEYVPDRYVRMAFVESFRRRARVFVEVHGQHC